MAVRLAVAGEPREDNALLRKKYCRQRKVEVVGHKTER